MQRNAEPARLGLSWIRLEVRLIIKHELDIDIPHLEDQFIGGEWMGAGDRPMRPVVSPSSEDILAFAALPTIKDADRAANRAKIAFDEGPWRSMSIEERAEKVERLCFAIEGKLATLNKAWSYESGATIKHAELLNNEVGGAVWRQMILDAKSIQWEEERGDALLLREPIGSVLAIMTFNGPVVLMAMKVVPALLAGCTVIAKHAPESPLTARLVAECAREANLPEGVLSFIPGDAEITKYLVGHEAIDMVTLTGGTQHGVDVVKRTANRLARTTLELGGKSAAIIGGDCDQNDVLDSLIPGSSSFMGQVCVNLSRILLPKASYGKWIEALKNRYDAIQLGDPLKYDTEQGPISVKRGLERTESYVALAQSEGAELAAGGCVPREFEKGWWYRPTLLSKVNNSMAIAREEIFGPVVVAIPYGDINEAVTIANDSPFGLAASVYMSDEDLALSVAKRLQSGSVAINSAGISFLHPFGGYKQSGWGKECGLEGIMEFTQIKQVSGRRI